MIVTFKTFSNGLYVTKRETLVSMVPALLDYVHGDFILATDKGRYTVYFDEILSIGVDYENVS